MPEFHNFIALALLAAALASATGCSSVRMPWDKPKVVLPGVKTPDERILEIRQLGKDVGKKSQMEWQVTAQELGAELQREDDPLVKIEILKTLGSYPVPAAAAALKGGLEDSSPEVRIAACKGWAKRGGVDAANELSHIATSDSSIDVRLAATKELGQNKDPLTIRALGEVLNDPDPALQFQAVASLKQASGKDYGNDVRAWRQFTQGQTVTPETPSIADRMRRMIY